MQQFIIYEGFIDKEPVEQFINKLNDFQMLQAQNPDLDLTVNVYLDTPGGDCYLSNIMIDSLNRSLKSFKIEITTGSQIMSAGMDILIGFKGKINVEDDTIGMIHKINSTINTKQLNNKFSIDSFAIHHQKKINERFFERVKNFLTKEEIVRYDQGLEIYFDSKKLIKIING